MRALRLLTLLIPLLLILAATNASAVPANPAPVETTQPDGTPITVRIFGDEWYHFYECEDGYAIVQDENERWVYAELDGFGEFEATQHAVGVDDIDTRYFLDGVGRHLREYAEEKVNRKGLFFDRTMPGILESAAEQFKDGGKAAINVPVVLIQYSDFYASQSVSSFTNMMNQANYNGTGSFQDYYNEVSYNNLTVTATVVGWFAAPFTRATYKYGTGSMLEFHRARALARSAVDAAETAGFNWVPFDNDGNGDVDCTFIVHQGPGAECGSINYIWSHAWFLNAGGGRMPYTWDLSVTYDTKLIDRYIMMPEENCSGGHVDIGVFCHEFGHALGLPDLYDVDGSSAGIGHFGVMSTGSWGGDGMTPQTPVHMCAWSKIQNGWITPTVVNSNTTGTPIPDVETNATVFKLWTNGAPGLQYFLVENRQKTGFDANLFQSGLAIWHIDENMITTNNSDNANEAHKLVDLEEADGLAQMDAAWSNYGDTGDLYPGSTSNTTFDDTSNPNSKDYAGGSTSVAVQNINAATAPMTADFTVGTGGTGVNLMVRDCAADVGTEPNTQCMFNWWQSPDIWIDNNDDGVMDPPIFGQNNHLYVRGWNIGATTATNVNLQCWYVNPTLGLNFGLGSIGNIPIIDSVSGSSILTIPTMAPLLPTAGGTGYRNYFNWVIPWPSSGIGNYCIGCVLDNAVDPQLSPIPGLENNLAQINFQAFFAMSGSTPVKAKGAPGDDTIFQHEVRVINNTGEPSEFEIEIEFEDFIPEWEIIPMSPVSVPTLMPEEETIVVFDVIKHNSQHRDSTRVRTRLFKLPEVEPVGGITSDFVIDDLPPLPVGEWKAEIFRPLGDNLVRPAPTGQLSWEDPDSDEGGFPERIRFYEIYVGPDPGSAMSLDPELLVGETHGDDDLMRPGFQRHVFEEPEKTPLFYTVVAVDMAGNRSMPVEALELTLPAVAAVPDLEAVSRVSQNYPNPFNPMTSVDFTLTRGESVRVSVYDSAGRLVKVLTDQLYGTGTHSLTWNGRDDRDQDVASGIYFLEVKSASLDESRKMTLVR